MVQTALELASKSRLVHMLYASYLLSRYGFYLPVASPSPFYSLRQGLLGRSGHLSDSLAPTVLRVCHAPASVPHSWPTTYLRGVHREQMSFEESLCHFDNALGRLDNLFMRPDVKVTVSIVVGALFYVSWTKVLCLGSPACFVTHHDCFLVCRI